VAQAHADGARSRIADLSAKMRCLSGAHSPPFRGFGEGARARWRDDQL